MNRVIYIHGIYTVNPYEEKIVRNLKDEGVDVVCFPIFYGVFDTEKHLALIERINSFLEDNSTERFTIVGYSFGGIIAYSLSQSHYARIDKIVTMASPHRVKFKWFQKVLKMLPYKEYLDSTKQETCGFLFDLVVPHIFTQHRSSRTHRTFMRTHSVISHKRFLCDTILNG